MRVDLLTLLGLSGEDRASTLATGAESQWFERKSWRVSPEGFAKALIGMANAEGGLVAVGVSHGQIEPGAPAEQKVNSLRRVPHTHCAPPPHVRFHELDLGRDEAHCRVLLAEVRPGETLHETTAGHCYLRVGDSTMRLTGAQREELAYDRGGSQYEGRPMAGVQLDDLDGARLAALREALGSTTEISNMLAARSLLNVNGSVTIAAYLLLAARPHEQMPHAYVRILRHLDVYAGTGARQMVLEGGDHRVEGSIPEVIDRAAELIERHMPQRRALRPDGRFGPVPVVPRDAWLEGLVNAVVHRSYSMVGDHIRVEIFPDRVRIESPGRFPGIVDPRRPLEIARYARNPRIAWVCNDLGFTQEGGEGIKRIFDEMRTLGLTDPVYWQTSGSVRLTLQGTSRLAPDVAARLPTGADDVLRTLRLDGSPLGTGELSAAIGLARPATLRALRALRDLGEIEWRGNSPKDPRATWSLPRGG